MTPALDRFVSYLANQIKKLGVTIKTNTEYTPSICDKENPDLVIIATGSSHSRPPITGIDRENVVTASDVLLGKVSTKDNVVVAGGGQVGCETAVYLASLGKQVTIVEMLSTLAADEEMTRRIFLMKAIKEYDIECFTETKIKGIDVDCIQCETCLDTIEIEAATVVLALGMESNNKLAKELEGKVPIKVIGDATEARDALEAVREGYLAAVQA